MSNKRLQAILFDFDGVIMDSESALFESWQRSYVAHGCELPLELWAANVGGYSYDVFDPLDYLQGKCGVSIDKGIVNAARRACYLLHVNKLDAMSGAREAIAAAKSAGMKLAVASSSSTNWVPVHLKRLGLYDYFDVIVCGNEVAAVKPDPAIYNLALERLGVAPANAFVVEDSPKGIAAARAASLYCVAVPNPVTRASNLEGHNRLLQSLTEHPFENVIAEVENDLSILYD